MQKKKKKKKSTETLLQLSILENFKLQISQNLIGFNYCYANSLSL